MSLNKHYHMNDFINVIFFTVIIGKKQLMLVCGMPFHTVFKIMCYSCYFGTYIKILLPIFQFSEYVFTRMTKRPFPPLRNNKTNMCLNILNTHSWKENMDIIKSFCFYECISWLHCTTKQSFFQDSILDIKVPVFKPGGQMPEIKSYMDSFPFPFYIILRDINSLPVVLSDALRQWFELVTSVDRWWQLSQQDITKEIMLRYYRNSVMLLWKFCNVTIEILLRYYRNSVT